jgi:hypothetical protein
MKYANKILYIGAGCHIKPVTHFKQTKEFIFIDTQPRSENESIFPKFNKEFYKEHFINNLEAEFVNYGFTVDTFYKLDNKYFNKIISWKQYIYYCFHKVPKFVNPMVIIFINKKTNQKVRYYISTNFQLNMNKILKNDINSCDGMIVSGYDPHVDILDFFDCPKIIFWYIGTDCVIDDNNLDTREKDRLSYFLKNCICNTQYFFKEFYLVEDIYSFILL